MLGGLVGGIRQTALRLDEHFARLNVPLSHRESIREIATSLEQLLRYLQSQMELSFDSRDMAAAIGMESFDNWNRHREALLNNSKRIVAAFSMNDPEVEKLINIVDQVKGTERSWFWEPDNF
jgi:hypothetical protein